MLNDLLCSLSADDFTLEKIIELGLDQFAEQISEVSGAASKELSIEQVGVSGCASLEACNRCLCVDSTLNVYQIRCMVSLVMLMFLVIRQLQALLRAGNKLPWILGHIRTVDISDSSMNILEKCRNYC